MPPAARRTRRPRLAGRSHRRHRRRAPIPRPPFGRRRADALDPGGANSETAILAQRAALATLAQSDAAAAPWAPRSPSPPTGRRSARCLTPPPNASASTPPRLRPRGAESGHRRSRRHPAAHRALMFGAEQLALRIGGCGICSRHGSRRGGVLAKPPGAAPRAPGPVGAHCSRYGESLAQQSSRANGAYPLAKFTLCPIKADKLVRSLLRAT